MNYKIFIYHRSPVYTYSGTKKITCHVVVLVSRWAHWGWEEWAASRRSLVVHSQGMLQGTLGWDMGNGRSPDM